MEKYGNQVIPEKIMRHADCIVEAKRCMQDMPIFNTKIEAYDAAKVVAVELDLMAYNEGMLGRRVKISGPSVIFPSVKKDPSDGEITVLASHYGDEDMSAYETILGTFYGFDVVTMAINEDENGDSDDVEGDVQSPSEYKPQLVFIVKLGAKFETPLVSFTLSAYGNVEDTDISFFDDDFADAYYQNLSDIKDKGRHASDSETKEISYFMRYYEEPLNQEGFRNMHEAIEGIRGQRNNELTTELTDKLLEMFYHKIEREIESVSLEASVGYHIHDFGLKTQDIQFVRVIGNNENILEDTTNFRDFVILPTFYHARVDDTSRIYQNEDLLSVYGVYDYIVDGDGPQLLYIALKDMRVSQVGIIEA